MQATIYGREKLAECRAILGGYRDPFAQKWAVSKPAERVLLLNIAREPGYYAGRTWDALPQQTRDKIKSRARDLRNWLQKVCPE